MPSFISLKPHTHPRRETVSISLLQAGRLERRGPAQGHSPHDYKSHSLAGGAAGRRTFLSGGFMYCGFCLAQWSGIMQKEDSPGRKWGHQRTQRAYFSRAQTGNRVKMAWVVCVCTQAPAYQQTLPIVTLTCSSLSHLIWSCPFRDYQDSIYHSLSPSHHLG